MRFSVSIDLNQVKIPKDYSRMFLSLIKHFLSKNNPEVFHEMYGEGGCRKNFTYSVYLGSCKFLKEEIELEEKKVHLTVSSFDTVLGIEIYNALLSGRFISYPYKENVLTIKSIKIQYEKPITKDEVTFKTISSIVVREHNKETNKDWFHSLSDETGKRLFLKNLKIQLLEVFPDEKYDIEQVNIEVLKNKDVIVKHYGIEVLSNICVLKIMGRTYLNEYLYKAGIGSMKSTGFGMVTII